MPESRIIKKYPNRRLYDTEISSYITLEEVRQLVVDGEKFEVRDAKTGRDHRADRSELRNPIRNMKAIWPTHVHYAAAVAGDPLLWRFHAGLHGQLSGKSLQVFLDQQQQFRSQLNNIMGRTPWSMLNGLALNATWMRGARCNRDSSTTPSTRRVRARNRKRRRRKASPDRFAHVNSGNFSIVAALGAEHGAGPRWATAADQPHLE